MFFNQISLSFERNEQFLSMNVLLQFACINFDISTLLIIALSYGTTGSKILSIHELFQPIFAAIYQI